jgi:hypothetical protein
MLRPYDNDYDYAYVHKDRHHDSRLAQTEADILPPSLVSPHLSIEPRRHQLGRTVWRQRAYNKVERRYGSGVAPSASKMNGTGVLSFDRPTTLGMSGFLLRSFSMDAQTNNTRSNTNRVERSISTSVRQRCISF